MVAAIRRPMSACERWQVPCASHVCMRVRSEEDVPPQNQHTCTVVTDIEVVIVAQALCSSSSRRSSDYCLLTTHHYCSNYCHCRLLLLYLLTHSRAYLLTYLLTYLPLLLPLLLLTITFAATTTATTAFPSAVASDMVHHDCCNRDEYHLLLALYADAR